MASRIQKAYDILKSYNGSNNQIKYYKVLYEANKLILEDFGTEYILKNYDYEPIEVNKVVRISDEFGKSLQTKYELDFMPAKVKIGRIIGEMGGSYHGYVKFRQSVEPQLMYFKKRSVLDKLIDVDYMSLDIDFDKYDNMPSNKGRKLKEHQKTGAKFLIANKKCILADGMGTGKTTTSIIGALAGGYKNILVITTASLKTTWVKDIELYEDKDNISIVSGSKWDPGKKFTITNYDIVQNFYTVAEEPVYENQNVLDKEGNIVEVLRHPVFIKDKNTGKMVPKMQKSRKQADIKASLAKSPLFLENYDCVIIDEAQKLSNNTSIRYKTIYDFLHKANPKAIYLLSGTPLTNNPMNLYHILKLIDADVTADYQYYVKRYCGGREMHLKDGRTIMTTGEATNLDELRLKIKDIYIRRLASETGEMVNKDVIRKYYDLTDIQRAEYDRLWEDYQNAQSEEKRDESEQYRQLVEGSLVRQFLAKAMTQNTIDLVDDYISQGEKVVIITCYQEEMDLLKKHFGKKCVCYNGTMTSKQKDKAQESFMKDDKVMVFIGQIEACGVGLSLPISRIAIFNSYSWSEASNRQAEDRIYRLTQTRDVECIYMLFNDSISQDMFDKVLYKGFLMDTIVKSESQKN